MIGDGYHLTFSKAEHQVHEDEENDDNAESADANARDQRGKITACGTFYKLDVMHFII